MSTHIDIEAKLRRLLALAHQQDNEHEAATAFAHAQRIATLHGLDLDDLVDANADEHDLPPSSEPWSVADIDTVQIDSWKRAVAWKVRLSSHLDRANNCEGYYNPSGLWSYGQPADLHVVIIMYRAIVSAIDKLAREALRSYSGRVSPKSFGRSFRLRCVAAIGKRLRAPTDEVEALRESMEPTNFQALARVQTALCRIAEVKSAVERYADEQLDLRDGRGFSAAGTGYAEGLRAGERIDLPRPAQGLS